MSFALHHGPNGSYKTFSVVQRFLIEALYEGRTVVTNIRGMDTVDNIEKAFKKPLPPMAELIFIDWEDPNAPGNIELLQRWFHWIPFGSLFILDECHNFYPEDTKTFLKQLDNFEPEASYYIEPMGGSSIISPVNGKEVFRPKDILNAFRMHRHFEWDIFFTTPDVDFLPKKIRLSAEFCYRHRDLSGLIPWKKGRWKEVQHSARTTGDSNSSAINTAEYKRDKRVFECYSSTATGTYKESMASKSIFSGGALQFVIGIWFLAVITLASVAYSRFSQSEDTQADTETVLSDSKESSVKTDSVYSDTSNGQSVNEGVRSSDSTISYQLPYGSQHLYLKGVMKFEGSKDFKYLFVSVSVDGVQRLIFERNLIDMGYSLFAKKENSVVIRKHGVAETYKVNLLIAEFVPVEKNRTNFLSGSASNNKADNSQNSDRKLSISSLSHSSASTRFEKNSD